MTACDRAARLLPERWAGTLAGTDQDWLAEHLASCTACAGEDTAWQQLAPLAVRDPAPGLQAGFEAKLNAAVRQEVAGRGWRTPLIAAAAVALLAIGLAAGWWWRGATRRPGADDATQIANLRQEVEATRQLAVLSLLRQDSANTRLQGVVDSSQVPPSDPTVRAALITTLEHDPSPDVRLAAIMALARPGADSAPALVEAFHYQNSPLVQIAVLDHLAGSGAAPARALLHTVSQSRAFSSEVRQRAAWALRQ